MGSEFGGGSEVSDTSEGNSDKVPFHDAEVKPRRRLSQKGIRAMQGIGVEESVIPQGQESKDVGKPTSQSSQ